MASALTRQGLKSLVESAHVWVAIIGSEKEGGPDFLRSA